MGKTPCHKCGKVGHYQRVCRSINTIETRENSPNGEWKFLGAVTTGSEGKPWMTLLDVNNR